MYAIQALGGCLLVAAFVLCLAIAAVWAWDERGEAARARLRGWWLRVCGVPVEVRVLAPRRPIRRAAVLARMRVEPLPVTAEELAEWLCCTLPAMRAHLRRLERAKLVVRMGRAWRAV